MPAFRERLKEASAAGRRTPTAHRLAIALPALRVYDKRVKALRNRGAATALGAAAGVWLLGWGINFIALDSFSPRGHSIVLLATIIFSAAVAIVGVGRALAERMGQARALLGAIVVGLVVAGLEFSTLIVVALNALSHLDGS